MLTETVECRKKSHAGPGDLIPSHMQSRHYIVKCATYMIHVYNPYSKIVVQLYKFNYKGCSDNN